MLDTPLLVTLLSGTPSIVAFLVEGPVTAADVERISVMIESALARSETVNLFAEIEDLKGFTPEAVLKDLTYGLKKLKDLSRFGKVALVTDQDWVRRVVVAEAKLFPGVEIKTFPSGEKRQALAWVRS